MNIFIAYYNLTTLSQLFFDIGERPKGEDMKKSNILFLLTVLVTVLFTLSSCYYEAIPTKPVRETVFTEEWYEEHKADSAYELGNKEELKTLRDLVNNGEDFTGKTITLVEDIDLAGEEWIPIGGVQRKATDNKMFSGVFDGNGHTISGLSVNETNDDSAVGLFGVAKNIEIKNLTVEGSVKAFDYGAGFVGYVQSDESAVTKIENCVNNVKVEASSAGGFIAGAKDKGSIVIANCTNNGEISGKAKSAGIICYTQTNLLVENCHNTAKVSSDLADSESDAAGILGLAINQGCTITIKDSSNSAPISAKVSGGIVSKSNSPLSIENSINKGEINGTVVAGGLVGETIEHCIKSNYLGLKNEGTVKSDALSGGIIGRVGTSFESFNIAQCDGGKVEGEGIKGQLIGHYDIKRAKKEEYYFKNIVVNLSIEDTTSSLPTIAEINMNHYAEYTPEAVKFVVNEGTLIGKPVFTTNSTTPVSLVFEAGSKWKNSDSEPAEYSAQSVVQLSTT